MSKNRIIKVQTPGEPLVQAQVTPIDIIPALVIDTIEPAAVIYTDQSSAQTPGELPDADTIDATTLDSPLLTKQGYLLPEKK